MPGSNNRVQFANGYRLEASAAEEWQIMQATATDVSCVNNAGNPEGVVPANMGSLCHDRTNGDLYVKNTGTGTTGWLLIATGVVPTTDLHTARFIVSAGGTTDGANYTTIASAYAAAVAAGAPQTVFIQPGTYTENLTLTPGINLSAFSCDAYTPNVIIKGKLTYTTAGTVSISGCELLTNADFAISCTGANNCKMQMINCKLFANDANAIEFTNSNANSKIEFYSSIGDLAATRAYFTHSGAGKIGIYNSLFGNNGASTTASTLSGSGSIDINNSYYANAITSSSTSVITMGSASYHGALIAGGTGAGQFISQSILDGGTSASISIGAGVSVTITNCTIESTNGTAAIAGAGTLVSGSLVYSNSATNVTTTTQTCLIASNDAIKVTVPGAYPYTVLKQDALVSVDTSAARTINLPASPQTGEKHIIKDAVGSAASNNITVQGNGSNIDGAASATINVAYGSGTFIYNGTIWLNV